jgi:phosphatidylserine decarboxylase
LKARPISPKGAILPADARYRFFQNISETDGFVVKGKKFCLAKLLGDSNLAKKNKLMAENLLTLPLLIKLQVFQLTMQNNT